MDAAVRVLNRKFVKRVEEKVYPVVFPENPKQFVDVEDEFDLEFKRKNSKRRLLNFATRCRIIEERFGSYGEQYIYPIMGVCEISRKLSIPHEVVSYHIRRYVKNKGK